MNDFIYGTSCIKSENCSAQYLKWECGDQGVKTSETKRGGGCAKRRKEGKNYGSMEQKTVTGNHGTVGRRSGRS